MFSTGFQPDKATLHDRTKREHSNWIITTVYVVNVELYNCYTYVHFQRISKHCLVPQRVLISSLIEIFNCAAEFVMQRFGNGPKETERHLEQEKINAGPKYLKYTFIFSCIISNLLHLCL